jgi:glycosyltransferase involved in cell wall biosynthesis
LIKYDKFDVKIVPMPWGGTPQTALDEDTEDNRLLKSKFLTTQLMQKPELHIQISIPNEFQPQGKYNIGITAGIESSLCRAEWIEGLNRMDMNIVPSKHAKTVFEESKFKKKEKNGMEVPVVLTKPVEVLFEGSDLNIYKKTNKIEKEVSDMLNNIPEDFCFLFVGHWLQGNIGDDRKDISMLIKTFSETFKGKKKAPALILKSSGATFSEVDKDDILKKINKAREGISNGKLPNVYLIHGEFTANEINSLYNHSKVKAHVSFTHGEGYGRPLQEASLSGKPVIASNWSGHIDFLGEGAVMLPGQVKQVPRGAVNDWIIKESSWFNVNYSIAAQRMIDVYENYDKYLPKADALRKRNEEKFSLAAMDAEFSKILDKYIPEFTATTGINLPKLQKIGGSSNNGIQLPKLKRVGDTPTTSNTIQLPKLKKKG